MSDNIDTHASVKHHERDAAEIAKAAKRIEEARNAGTIQEGGKDTNEAKGKRV